MGLFDDLIPRRSTGGLFDDLIPQKRTQDTFTSPTFPEEEPAPRFQTRGLGVPALQNARVIDTPVSSSTVDTTDDARAARSFANSAYMDDGRVPNLPTNTPVRDITRAAPSDSQAPVDYQNRSALGVTADAVKRGALRVASSLPMGMAAADARALQDAARSDQEIIWDTFKEFAGPQAGRSRSLDISTPEKATQALTDMGVPSQTVTAFRQVFNERLAQANDARENRDVYIKRYLTNAEAGGGLLEKAYAIPMSPAAERMKERLAQDETLSGTLSALVSNPLDALAFLGEVGVESAPAIAASMATGAVTRNPAISGAMLGTGAAMQEFGASAYDVFQDAGLKIDSPDAAKAALDNPALWAAAGKRGATRATVIALFEMMGQGVAAQQLMKSEVGNAIVQTLTQMGTGAGGEAAAQFAAGEQLKGGEILIEGLAEGLTAPFEVSAAAISQRRSGSDTPPEDRERLNSPRLTDNDRASPLPNDVIDDGKKAVEDLLSGRAPTAPNAGIAPLDEAAPNVRTPTPEAVQRPLPTDRLSPTMGAAPSADTLPQRQEATVAPQAPVAATERAFEDVPEVEGDTPTGRTVRVYEDGQVEFIVQEQDAQAQEPVPQTQEPVAVSDVSTPVSEQSAPFETNQYLRNEDLTSVEADPETFQYKSGGDSEGVTDRLLGVKKWETPRAGQAIVYEYADGRRVIADGHQRLGLAKRLSAEGQDVAMPVTIRREVDGYTPEQVMVEAALKNVAESDAKDPNPEAIIDAAKVLRARPNITPADMNLPNGEKSALGRNALSLRNLSDEAFGMLVNERASMRSALAVANAVSDKAAQANILSVVEKSGARNRFEAEMVAKQAAADTVTQTQDSLFGSEDVTETLYLERARVMDQAIKRLRNEASAFKTILRNAGNIENVGENRVDRDASAQKAAEDAAAQEYITRLANSKGPISDALTEAARSIKAGGNTGQAVTGFVQAVRSGLQEGSTTGQGQSLDGRNPQQVRGTEAGQVAPNAERVTDGDLFAGDANTQRSADADLPALPAVETVDGATFVTGVPKSDRARLGDAAPKAVWNEKRQAWRIPEAQADAVRAIVNEKPQAQNTPAKGINAAPNEGFIIRNKDTGEAVMETRDQAKIDALNTEKYEAVPVRQHLAELSDTNSKARKAAEQAPAAKKESPAVTKVNDIVAPDNAEGTGFYTNSDGDVQIDDLGNGDAEITITTSKTRYRGRAKETKENSQRLKYSEVKESLSPAAREAVEKIIGEQAPQKAAEGGGTSNAPIDNAGNTSGSPALDDADWWANASRNNDGKEARDVLEKAGLGFDRVGRPWKDIREADRAKIQAARNDLPTTERTEAGTQTVVPGAEQSTERSEKARDADRKREADVRGQQSKMRTGVEQNAPGGLFDTDQGDMFKEQRQPSAQDAATVEAALPDLMKRLKQVMLGRVNLEMVSGATFQGAFEKNGDRLRILIGATQDGMKTLNHEVIHALKSLNLFTDKEWAALVAQAKAEWMDKYDIANRYDDLDYDAQIEEAIAEAFADFVAERTEPGPIKSAFAKMRRMFRALKEWVTGNPSVQGVFEAVDSGRVGGRQSQGGTFDPNDARIRYQRPMSARQKAQQTLDQMPRDVAVPDRAVFDELFARNRSLLENIGQAKSAIGDRMDVAREYMQDRILPLRRAQEAIERETGQPIAEEMNAYVKEETYHGKVGRRLDDIQQFTIAPISDLIADSNDLDTAKVNDYLTALHAEERNARIAKINPEMPDGGSGMTNAEAQKILKDAKMSKDYPALKEIARLIGDLRDRTLQLRVDAGLMTAKDAAVLKSMYQNYVPLKGFEEFDGSEALSDRPNIGRGYSVKGPETKRALGRKSRSFDVLANMLTQAQEVAIRAEKNRVGKAVFDLASQYPSDNLWKVREVETKRVFNKQTGLVETRSQVPTARALADNEMAVKIDGKEYRIEFLDPRLARAMGAVKSGQMGPLMQWLSLPARYFSAVNTMIDPEFVIRNAFRDMQAAQINIRNFGEGDRNAIAKGMIKNWPKAFKAAYQGQKGKSDTEWTKWYREFEEAGAKVSFWKMEDAENMKADLDRQIALRRGNKLVRAGKVMVSPSALFSIRDNAVLGFIERTNLAVDNAVRLAAYVEARKAGWSKQKAASLSKNLTVNFNRRGHYGPVMNALYPFYNAGMQGTQVLFRAMSNPKRMSKYIVGMIGLGVMNDLINAAISDEDDDGVLAYDKLQKHKQEMSLVFSTGDDVVTIPLSYGYNVFPYMGTLIGQVMRGVKDPDEAIVDFADAAVSAFSPVYESDGMRTILPMVMDLPYDLATNSDWLHRPIRPENPYGDYGPDAYKFYGGASEWAKGLADVANRATGGTIAEPGMIDISPEYIDHIWGFASGGAGRFVSNTGDMAAKILSGKTDEIEGYRVPFARQAFSETGHFLDRDRYYRFRDEVNEAVDAREVAQEAGEPLSKLSFDLSKLKNEVKLADKVLRAVRNERAAVGPDATPEQRKEWEARESKAILRFNEKYVDIAGASIE